MRPRRRGRPSPTAPTAERPDATIRTFRRQRGDTAALVAYALPFRYDWQDGEDSGAMGRDRLEHAWNRGFDAGCKLRPLDCNPYKSGGRFFEAWEDGWRNGSASDPEVAIGGAVRRRIRAGGSPRTVPDGLIGRRLGFG